MFWVQTTPILLEVICLSCRFVSARAGDIKVYDVDGPLFFTSANRLVKLLDPLKDDPATEVELRFGEATLMDFTSVETLHKIALNYQTAGGIHMMSVKSCEDFWRRSVVFDSFRTMSFLEIICINSIQQVKLVLSWIKWKVFTSNHHRVRCEQNSAVLVSRQIHHLPHAELEQPEDHREGTTCNLL